ncbi:hypothetical protein MBBA_2233 [Methanoculleus bourgensis]|jgi:hypothetical protein|uniref:hypothetical protein n=1 Tax=Methanoculleus bourgensis TaxID=83986 RepID=UPI0007BCD5E5|nr:hypothetical protein MBBA_2233 [Methanoculleus bourgensis]
MKNDEAVSTVIALMLILGIIVTLIAIYSATYLPGLKQQSEIEHSREVANAFVRFGSDIDYVISHKKTARFSEPFSLGGGAVLLSPVRSSGLVAIEGEPLVNVTVGTETGSGVSGPASLVNISYVPSFTAWEPQGYRWEYGLVVVTKDDVAVPQSSRYNTMNETLEDRSEFFRSFVGLEMDPAGTNLVITLVNLFPKESKSFITGSGIVALEVNATASESSLTKVTNIVFEDLAPDPEESRMEDHLNSLCDRVCDAGLATYKPEGSSHILEFDPGHPVTVTLRTVNVEVSVC